MNTVTALADHRRNVDIIAAALLTGGPGGGWRISTMPTTDAAAVEGSSGRKMHQDDVTKRPREGALYRWTTATVFAAALVAMAFAITNSVHAVQVVARTADSELIAVERYLQRSGIWGLEVLF